MKNIFISLIIFCAIGVNAQPYSKPFVEISNGKINFYAPLNDNPQDHLMPDIISINTNVIPNIMLPPGFDAQAFRNQEEVQLNRYSQNLDTREGQEGFINTYLLLIHINRERTAEFQKEYAEALNTLRKAKGVWVRDAMELVEEAEKRDRKR